MKASALGYAILAVAVFTIVGAVGLPIAHALTQTFDSISNAIPVVPVAAH